MNERIPIDIDQAKERVGQDEDLLRELIDIYREEFTEKMKDLKKAVAQKDFETIRTAGHYLKGSSGNLGMTILQEASYSMEKAGEEKNIEKAEKILSTLKKEFDRLNEFLKESF